MSYMNKRQLIKAYNSGLLDDVKSQLVRYGVIHNVKDWEITDIPRYNGAHRRYQIEHHKIQWEIDMHNGEVIGIAHTIGDHKFW